MIYTDGGDAENRTKELKKDRAMNRTSYSCFLANPCRVLLTAAAYISMRELRLHARHTDYARAQVGTLRLRLLMLAAWIQVSVRLLGAPAGTPCSRPAGPRPRGREHPMPSGGGAPSAGREPRAASRGAGCVGSSPRGAR